MPKFQARYFDNRDETVPVRVEPVEALDHAAALERANAALGAGEVRVEVVDIDDEFRRGTPNQDRPLHGLGKPASPTQGPVQGAAQLASDVGARLGDATDKLQDVYTRTKDKAANTAGDLDRFVREQPYTALGVAAAAGLLLGFLFGREGRDVVYVGK